MGPWALTGVVVVAAALFVIRERTARHPLLDLGLIARRLLVRQPQQATPFETAATLGGLTLTALAAAFVILGFVRRSLIFPPPSKRTRTWSPRSVRARVDSSEKAPSRTPSCTRCMRCMPEMLCCRPRPEGGRRPSAPDQRSPSGWPRRDRTRCHWRPPPPRLRSRRRCRGDRAEDLFTEGGHRCRHSSQHRWRVEQVVVGAAGAELGALAQCLGHDSVDIGKLRGIDERAERDLLRERVADGKVHGASGEQIEVLVGDRVEHNVPTRGHANLALVQEGAPGAGRAGDVEVRVVENDERIVSAELERDPFQRAARRGTDFAPDRGRARERHHTDPGMPRNRGPRLRVSGQHMKKTLGQSGLLEEPCEEYPSRDGGLRVGRQHDCVAERQCRGWARVARSTESATSSAVASPISASVEPVAGSVLAATPPRPSRQPLLGREGSEHVSYLLCLFRVSRSAKSWGWPWPVRPGPSSGCEPNG
jgi:hypothetical protein